MLSRQPLFRAGVAAVTIGVALHLPMYVQGRDMGYRLAGMPLDAPMLLGMFLIVGGLVAAIAGLVPPHVPAGAVTDTSARVRALDDAPIQRAHVALMLVMAAAVIAKDLRTIRTQHTTAIHDFGR